MNKYIKTISRWELTKRLAETWVSIVDLFALAIDLAPKTEKANWLGKIVFWIFIVPLLTIITLLSALVVCVFCMIGSILVILNEIILWLFIKPEHWDRYRFEIW